jgi:hypothetical protein
VQRLFFSCERRSDRRAGGNQRGRKKDMAWPYDEPGIPKDHEPATNSCTWLMGEEQTGPPGTMYRDESRIGDDLQGVTVSGQRRASTETGVGECLRQRHRRQVLSNRLPGKRLRQKNSTTRSCDKGAQFLYWTREPLASVTRVASSRLGEAYHCLGSGGAKGQEQVPS